MPTYQEITERFSNAGCVLLTTREEYDKMKKPLAGVFHFRSSCTHNNTVTLTNFWYKGTGIICKDCVKKSISDRFTRDSKRDNLKQEYEGILKFTSFIEEEFYVVRTNEGCLSDLLIKPRYMDDHDKWMMIQMKTTRDICHNLYTFSFHDNNYKHCLVVCLCINDNKIWVLDYTQVIGKNKLNIGKTEKSEYFQFQIKPKNLLDCMHINYAFYNKFKYEYCVIPKNIYQQQEQLYKNLREANIPYLNFVYPDIEGRAYDFEVNNYKIQEKVASIAKKNSKKVFYSIGLNRSVSKRYNKGGHRCYNKGDNDFYWIWKKDDKDTFYIFPENVLIDRQYIQVDGNLQDKPKFFTLADWTSDYKYSLKDENLQKKIENIFGF